MSVLRFSNIRPLLVGFVLRVTYEKEANMKQTGRSMIEMLGVLAIIGILSIVGIAMYRRAVNHHHANTILDDVNRFAFVITEHGGYPEGEDIPKGDFKESGIYQLKGHQAYGGQYSITALNVPKGICEILIDKGIVDYKVGVVTAGGPVENEILYDTLNTDICTNDLNDIAFYFGDTSAVCNTDENEDTPCTQNSDCCGGDFCLLPSWPEELVGSKPDPNGTGRCQELTGDYRPQTVTLPNDQTWYRDSIFDGMNWWSAQNWCAALGKKTASRRDIGCPSLNNEYCTETGEEGSARLGTVLRALQDHGWSGMVWLEGPAYNYGSFVVHFGPSNKKSMVSTAGWSRGRHALCH